MDGKTQGGWWGSTVKGKRTPVLRQRSGNSLSITDVDFSLVLSLNNTIPGSITISIAIIAVVTKEHSPRFLQNPYRK
jgi:hypothetical protein